jgi:phage terminase large subunit GpA-like protein
LTAEQLITQREQGQIVKRWEIPEGEDRRNETLDCAVYSFAALFRMRPNWGALKKRLDEYQAAKNPEAKPVEKKPELTRAPRPMTQTRRRESAGRSFVGGWK